MAKGLAWREGVEEGLAVEVTCAGFSYRYTGCQAFSGHVAGTPGTLRASGRAAGGPQIGEPWSCAARFADSRQGVYFAGAVERTKRMAMRETVRSLRAYFILSGLATLFSYGRALWVNFQGPFTLTTVVGVIGIGFSLAFLYVGFSLPQLLRSSAGQIVTLLYVSTGWVVFVFLVGLLESLAPVAVITLLLSLLILWYLLKNVRRLAAEAQVLSSGTVPSGT